MNPKREAAERYPSHENSVRDQTDEQDAFLDGVIYALKEFGNMLDRDGSLEAVRDDEERAPSYIVLHSWASEAHHIADGIEES